MPLETPAGRPDPGGARPPAVRCSGVTKRFRRLVALDGVDLTVRPGVVTAIVGPNAAGKSTLIKSVLGLVRPDEGTIEVLGRRLDGGHAYRQRIGYMPQAARFPENLRGREVLRMLLDLREAGAGDRELLDRFRLGPELEKPVRTLSGGTRQKLSAALAFLFRPELLILDEPTAGLDPVASGHLKEKIRSAQSTGASVILASHIMSELEELAEDIVILLEGRVRYQGAIRDLTRWTGLSQLERAIASLMTREEP